MPVPDVWDFLSGKLLKAVTLELSALRSTGRTEGLAVSLWDRPWPCLPSCFLRMAFGDGDGDREWWWRGGWCGRTLLWSERASSLRTAWGESAPIKMNPGLDYRIFEELKLWFFSENLFKLKQDIWKNRDCLCSLRRPHLVCVYKAFNKFLMNSTRFPVWCKQYFIY